jgi:amyloid beta precursor protein binding protein 1
MSQFLAETGLLPLPGSVPDMKAQSSDYIALQNLYKSKARADVQSVLAIVRSTEKQLSRSTQIEVSEVEAFCKNAAHIKLVRGRPIQAAKQDGKICWGDRAKFAANALTDETSLVLMYIAFLAYDEYCDAKGYPPGGIEENSQEQLEDLTSLAFKLIDGLIAEAGKNLESDELGEIKEKAGEICQEM